MFRINLKKNNNNGETQKEITFTNSNTNKRLIKPLLVVRVGPGTNPKYGSHWTESLIAT